MPFKNENILTLPDGFPALAGITNCAAGDFGFANFESSRISEEYMASRILARKLCDVSEYGKIIPENDDQIIFSDDCHGYHHANGLIHFSPKKTAPFVLFSVTADCPTIVFASADQNLLGIVYSDYESCRLEIAKKAVELIKEKANLTAEDIFVGIFPGICGQCFEMKDDVGLFFPEFYKNGKLNLGSVILNQLFIAGILAEKIFLADYCSFCTQSDGTPSFFSFKRDKTAKRNAVFITRKSD